MNTTHRKKNAAEGGTFSMTYRKWFTRGMACAALTMMVLLFAAGSAQAASDSWKANAAGNWADVGKWTGNQIPGSTTSDNTDVATFSINTNPGRTVTVDANRYIGGITFGNTSGQYVLSGGILHLNNGGMI